MSIKTESDCFNGHNRPPRILVVDDEKSIRVSTRAFLLNAGYDVESVGDTDAAVRLLTGGGFDVVVSDIILPGGSGIALLQQIRSVAPDVPVVMMTGAPTVDTAAEAVRAGACDYLVKPIGKNEFLRSVGNAARIKRVDDEIRRLEVANAAYRQELEGMVTSLKQEVERRTRAEEAKSDFLSMASHDLRTPLAISRQALGLLSDGKPDSLTQEQQDVLGIARRNLDRLSTLTDNLLDVSLLDSDKLIIEKQRIELDALVRQVCAMLQHSAKQNGLTLELTATEEIEIMADPERLLQVLTNLGSNGVKYTDSGSVTFRVFKDAQHAIVEVSDTGPGIPENELTGIFERFHRGKGALTKRKGGIGLGLFITRRLVELHGGTIVAQSEEGKGSVFTVRLPRLL